MRAQTEGMGERGVSGVDRRVRVTDGRHVENLANTPGSEPVTSWKKNSLQDHYARTQAPEANQPRRLNAGYIYPIDLESSKAQRGTWRGCARRRPPPARPRRKQWARAAHEKRPQRPCWRSEHRSERPRSMDRCRAELAVHAAPPRGALVRRQALAGDQRERVFGCESLLPLLTQGPLSRQRRPAGWRCVHGQLCPAAVHRSRALGPMFRAPAREPAVAPCISRRIASLPGETAWRKSENSTVAVAATLHAAPRLLGSACYHTSMPHLSNASGR